jgi:hypothetical protein
MKKIMLFLTLALSAHLLVNAQDNSDREQVMLNLKEKWAKRKVEPILEKHVTAEEASIYLNVETTQSSPSVIHTYFFPDKTENTIVRTFFYTAESSNTEGGVMNTRYVSGNTIYLKGFFGPWKLKTGKLPNFTGKVRIDAKVAGTFLVFATDKTISFGKEY